jgi:cellulose synthase/poly-beta-1,6-N-acetylglucosamine synthase-like glycosyltransferase
LFSSTCRQQTRPSHSLQAALFYPSFVAYPLSSCELLPTAVAVFAERGWEHEIIVCDNNSTDRTAEIALAAGALVVFEPIMFLFQGESR